MNGNGSKHPMRVVTRRTGLRADLIRAWERRHQAIAPSRTPGNRRLYSDADIARLQLIRKALAAGWQIGHVASLDDGEIRQLLSTIPPEPELRVHGRGSSAEEHLKHCLDSVVRLDEDGLRRRLEHAAVDLGRTNLLERCLVPLLVEIGRGCGNGEMRPAHEHLASTVVRSLLDGIRGSYPPVESTPGLVVTTPRFQHHELGAMLATATARGEGWRTTYLGPNLPAEEIAAAVIQRNARAAALSITFPADDAELPDELRRLRRMLPAGVDVLVGGRATDGYEGVLQEIGAVRLRDLAGLRGYLSDVRSGKAPS